MMKGMVMEFLKWLVVTVIIGAIVYLIINSFTFVKDRIRGL